MTTSFANLVATLREITATLPLDYPGVAALEIPSSYDADRATKQLWWHAWKMCDRGYAPGELLVGLAGTAVALAAHLPPHSRTAAAELLKLAAHAVEPAEKAAA